MNARRHRLARPVTAAVGAVLALGFLLVTAVPAVACSCMGPQPMSAYAGDPNQVVFTGVVMPPDAMGVPVQVTRWFQGPGVAPVVWLDRSGFGGDGASCGTAVPPAGAEWIFVSWRSEEGALGVNLCTPHAAASDPTGQSMFKDAVATFGDGITPQDPNATTETEPGGSPALPILAGGAIALMVVVGVAAVMLLARGGREEGSAD